MIKHAIILVGGKGERLKPYTDKVPKPMIEILGKPLMEYQIPWLKHQGVEHFILACGYKHEIIEEYFQDGSKWGVRIEYSVENEPLGRGGAFKKALEKIADASQIIGCNGDELIGEDLASMLEFHDANSSQATILLAPLVSSFGVVELEDGGKIVGFREKPTLPYWVSTGVYIFERSTIEAFPDVGDHETETFPGLAQAGTLFGYKAKAVWTTINTIKDLNEAGKTLPQRLPEYMMPKP